MSPKHRIADVAAWVAVGVVAYHIAYSNVPSRGNSILEGEVELGVLSSREVLFTLSATAHAYAVVTCVLGTARNPLLATAILLCGVVLHIESSRVLQGAVAQDTLVTDGVFAVSRNPQVVSMLAILLGLTIRRGVLMALYTVGVAWGYYNMCIVGEEDDLLLRFGAPYTAYKSRTPRYF
eukprot:Sspe_Gene.71821::Locus_42666_Transcript_1_1_Confidence_1.000_Length_619::g.71821::m.71821